jgi:hypothetical protein
MTTRPPPRASDDEVRRAWREVSNEQPPGRVDSAILEAARHALDEKPSSVVRTDDHPRTRRWFQRWQPALAAAGVCGLAFVLLQSLPREPDTSPTPSRSSPSAQTKATEAAATESPAPAGRAIEAAVPAPAASGELTRMDSAVTAGPEAKAAVRAADAEAEAPTIAPAARERAQAGHASLGAVNESSGSAAADSLEAQIARIEDLYDRGDRDGAAAALRRLRTQIEHADERLPESLRAWARTVP